jgi:hypothetical protein
LKSVAEALVQIALLVTGTHPARLRFDNHDMGVAEFEFNIFLTLMRCRV